MSAPCGSMEFRTSGNYETRANRTIDQQTDMRGHRDVKLPIIWKHTSDTSH